MDRSLRTLCALLVVVAVVSASVPLADALNAGDPVSDAATAQVQPLPGQNTTSVLLLGGETTAGYGQSAVDIAPTVSATHGVVGVQLREHVVRERLRSATTADRRRQILRQETEQLAADVGALQRMEQRALARYERGDSSAEELLRTLAVIDARARQAEQLTEYLREEVSQVQFLSSTEETLQSVQVDLATLRGPVREHVRTVFSGEEPATRIHLTVSGEAVALSTIRGNTYIREATDPGNVDANGSDRFASEGEVIDRIGTLYPWAWGSGDSVRTYTNFENGVYRINVDHSHGQLTGYLDGSSGNVFSEVQYKSLSRMPSGAPTTAEENGTVLQVNQSFAGGPVEVTVTNTTSGETVDGVVYLDGERVGRTNDGRLWLVGPADGYQVTAQTDAGNVTVSGQVLSVESS
jgi:hypothetical protein